MPNFETKPTERRSANREVDMSMAQDLSVYELSRDQLIEADHAEYARSVASRIVSLPFESMMPIVKADIVNNRMDSGLVAQYLNHFLSDYLGSLQFDKYLNLEEKN